MTFLAMVIILAARSEGRLVLRELTEEVGAGVLSPRQLQTASSSLRRTFALGRSLGQRRAGTTRRFYQACAELAHKKHQLTRVGDERGTLQRVNELRDQIRKLSRSAVT